MLNSMHSKFTKNKNEMMLSIEACTAEVSRLSSELEDYLKQNAYLYVYDYRVKQNYWKNQVEHIDKQVGTLRAGVMVYLYGLEKKRRECIKQYTAFAARLSELDSEIQIHNRRFMDIAVMDAYKVVGVVEGKSLDRQQMETIVKNPLNQLVVAGAGTGKTTTILGKVKYLLDKKMCEANEICILSFTRAAADEMEKRLYSYLQVPMQVSTFHSLGLGILRKVNGKAPYICNCDIDKLVKEKIKEHLADEEYAQLFIKYILYHRLHTKSEIDFDNVEKYNCYFNANPPITVLGEQVKSYGEMTIANFLTQYGIRYKYEERYKYDTRTEEYDQYYPDFYLPDYDIYIEYYGIDRNKQVPEYFKGKNGMNASQAYCEGMEWKREVHKKYNTTLIECYAYDFMEGNLLEKLRLGLEKHTIRMQEIDVAELFRRMTNENRSDKIMDDLSKIVQTVLCLMKGKGINTGELLKLCEERMPEQVVLVKLINPIIDDYEAFLLQRNEIDFADMLNYATDCVQAGKYLHPYKYIIVDEYQDLSGGQYQLLKALRTQRNYGMFCVGDDWQSIYRFNGSDINYILHFYKYWGNVEISRIETTYRFPQRMADVSGGFIMRNPEQLKKRIISKGSMQEQYVLNEVVGYTEREAIAAMCDVMRSLPKNSSVYLIGRYKKDQIMLKENSNLLMRYDNAKHIDKVVLYGREDLDICFYTAHKSKGLQADYVFVLNNKADEFGFPSRVQNPRIVDLLLEKKEEYPYAEERRLYYVALTRARKRTWLVIVNNNISEFAQELINQYPSEIRADSNVCPKCGAPMKLINGPYGRFWGCSRYAKSGCNYKKKYTIQ